MYHQILALKLYLLTISKFRKKVARKVSGENQIFALKFRNLLFKDNVHDFRRAVLMDASQVYGDYKSHKKFRKYNHQ